MQKIEWVSIFLVNLLTLKLQQQQTFPFAQTPVKIVLKKYLNEGLEAQILKKAYRNPPTPPPTQYMDMLASLRHAQTGDQL
jgi:hypothetical protein